MSFVVCAQTAAHRVALQKRCTDVPASALPAFQRHGRRSTAVRAGTAVAPSQKKGTWFPDIPKGPEDMNAVWFLDVYKEPDTIVPWDYGMQQPFVTKAVEEGFFSSPVIDLGCGLGGSTMFMGSKGLEVVGIDLSPDAIAEADKRLAATGAPAIDNVEFKTGSVLELPEIFGDRKFASALDCAMYHCLLAEDGEKYLASLHKQLVPGAKLMLVVMSPLNPAEGWIGPRIVDEAEIRHSLREEAGWHLHSLDYDARFEVPQMAANSRAPRQFANGFVHALVAVASRI